MASLDGVLLVLWHGAGGDIDERSMLAVDRAFTRAGARVVRARFAYREAGKKAPDRMPALMSSARETIAREVAREAPRALVLGGRSMGGRVASMLAAEGDRADGLLFLSYPLHPAGDPTRMRDEHLARIEAPMLFVSGDKDALAEIRRLRRVLKKLGDRATLELFKGADHGMKRASPDEIAARALAWAERCFPSKRRRPGA